MSDLIEFVFFVIGLIGVIFGTFALFCWVGAGPSAEAYNKLCGTNLTKKEYFWIAPNAESCMIQYKEKK